MRAPANWKVLVDAATLAARPSPSPDLSANEHGTGRELFAAFRQLVGNAEDGAAVAV